MTNIQEAVHHWAGGRALTRTSIMMLLYTEGLDPWVWHGTAGDLYHLRTIPYQRILWVAEGAIVINLPEQRRKITLQRGDRLDIPPDVAHQGIVGPQGLVCVEAQRAVAD